MPKNPAIESMLEDLANDMGGSRYDGKCVVCHKEPGEFTSELTKKEWSLSRMCEPCQNDFFNNKEEHIDS